MQNKARFGLLLFYSFLIFLFLTGCGIIGGSGGTGSASNDTTSPSFAGITLAYSPSKETIQLHWPQASDNSTSASKMKYRIYKHTADDTTAIYQDANLVGTVENTTTYTISTGLSGGQTYYCLVVAEDEAGNRSAELKTAGAAVLSDNVTVTAAPKAIADMSISTQVVDSSTVILSGADSGKITTGDFIVVDGVSGQTLKKVVSTTASQTGVQVSTTDASIDDFLQDGAINSSVSISDLADVSSAQKTSLKSGEQIKTYKDPAGYFEISEVYNNDAQENDGRLSKLSDYSSRTSLDQNVMLGYNLKFRPNFVTEAAKKSGSLDYVRVKAVGELSLDALAAYNITGTVSNTVTRRLYKGLISTRYVVGPVPVQQDISVEIYAAVEFNAQSSISMEGKLKASKKIEIGVEWTNANGWNLLKSSSFDKEITFDMGSQGTVTATLKLYPVLTVSFYKAANTSLYVVPTLALDAEARLIPTPVELTKFNTDFFVDAYLTANLKIWKWTLAEWESPHYDIYRASIFSLPEIKTSSAAVSVKVGQEISLNITITDGTNNKVPAANIAWSAEPSTGLTITPSSDNKFVVLSAQKEGSYVLTASAYGDGFLGTVGKRYLTINVTITGAAAPSNPSIKINSDASSTTSTSVTLNLSASDDVGVTGYCAKESSTTPAADDSCWKTVTSAANYSGNVSFTLSSGSGTKAVYVWFRDAAGSISSSASDSIQLEESGGGLIGTITVQGGGATYTGFRG
ncbi:MAG: hypothetical protein HY097_11260, partial [Nitrospinae bacterium]|nr:hypothetical protein [Nitrospinota bacterium]